LQLVLIADLLRRPKQDLLEPSGHYIEGRFPEARRELIASRLRTQLSKGGGGFSDVPVERLHEIGHGIGSTECAETARGRAANASVTAAQRLPEGFYRVVSTGSDQRQHRAPAKPRVAVPHVRRNGSARRSVLQRTRDLESSAADLHRCAPSEQRVYQRSYVGSLRLGCLRLIETRQELALVTAFELPPKRIQVDFGRNLGGPFALLLGAGASGR
jgi:hypothetical protein